MPRLTSDEYPVDRELFGPLGEAARKLATDLPRGAAGHKYSFMDNHLFGAITDGRRMTQIYWQEMFQRAHWAARLSLRRHERWQAASATAYTAANFYRFIASLRGMLEAALDANYSLGAIPLSFAENHKNIQLALRGELNGAMVCPEAEDRLIHFVYARKLARQEKETVPESHESLEPREYRNALGLPDQHREAFRCLYDELCAYCHPTAVSLHPLWHTLPDGKVGLAPLDDRRLIKHLVDPHRDAIEFSLSLSVTTSALCLRTMNRFAFPEVHCTAVDQWNFSDIATWPKIEQAFARPG